MFITFLNHHCLRLGLKLVLGLLLSCLSWQIQAAQEFRVLLVLSDENSNYQRFADHYRASLPLPNRVTVIKTAASYVNNEQQADLIVTVGSKAAKAVIGQTTLPTLMTMLPSNLYHDLEVRRPAPPQLSALYVDQPWSRYFELLFAALPDTRKIGVLLTPLTDVDIDALHKLAAHRGASLVVRMVNSPEQLFDSLEDILKHSEVLLAVPDSNIYSSNNIRNILMTSYRYNIPLIGLSQGYVNAGALSAVYSTPENLAQQASAMSHTYSLSKRLPAAQFPILYDVANNPEVARTLGIELKPAPQLLIQLQHAERGK